MSVPVAIEERMVQFFGAGPSPTYGRTLQIIDRDPYRSVRESLQENWLVEDYTDPNSDLSFCWALQHPDDFTVRLSMVGPYAVLLTPRADCSADPDVTRIIDSAGFSFLSEELLRTPVRRWHPVVDASVYEFLFKFDENLPWDIGLHILG